MNWKYHIPHTWDPPGSRTTWAEAWIMPDDPNYKDGSLWLTIDGLGFVPFDAEPEEYRQEAVKKLGDKEFWIQSTDMIVRAEDFTREEFLGWVETWIRQADFPFSGLIEAPFEEFANSNKMARAMSQMRRLPE